MTYILKSQEVFEKGKEKWEELEDVLIKHSKSINYQFLGLSYQQRVFYCVFGEAFRNNIFENDISIHISFRSKDKIKYPNKYGESFRNQCIAFILEKAEEILDDQYEVLEIRIREDYDIIESHVYKRQDVEVFEEN